MSYDQIATRWSDDDFASIHGCSTWRSKLSTSFLQDVDRAGLSWTLEVFTSERDWKEYVHTQLFDMYN